MKHVEIFTVIHRDIDVSVKINYDKGEVSLVQRGANNKSSTGFIDKPYMFANGNLEKMNRWNDVVDAIKVATEAAAFRLGQEAGERAKNEKGN